MNPDKLKWNTDFSQRIYELSEQRADDMLNERDRIYRRLFQEHPFKLTIGKGEQIVAEIMASKDFTTVFDLN
ncbi:MAG: hypothetical protein AAGJ93_06610 [Bacteroidota bacterium]